MNETWKIVLFILLGVGLTLFGIATLYRIQVAKPEILSRFDVQSSQMELDLQGYIVPVAYGQYWPFDASQTIKVVVISKKQVEDSVVVAVEINALGTTQPEKKDDKPKQVELIGVAKLNYELIENKWYLTRIESLTLKVQ